ncbi:MAG TPA: aldo/keto reductase, partial [Candidatus Caenarcaniphilales bacterium]
EQTDPRTRNKLFTGNNYEHVQQALDKLRPLAARYQATLSNLALAWLIAQRQTSAIVGASNAKQAAQNAKAADVHLCTRDLELIDAIGRIVTDDLDDNPALWNSAPVVQRALLKLGRMLKWLTGITR